MEGEWDMEDHLWEVDIMVVVVLEEEVDMEEADSEVVGEVALEDEEDLEEDAEYEVIGECVSHRNIRGTNSLSDDRMYT